MATRAQTAKATGSKKGVAKKRAKKLAQRKPTKTNRTAPKVTKAPRTKRDASAVIAHEAAANTPKTKARRAKAKARRVRATKTT